MDTDLKTYTKGLPRGGVSALARQLGISTVYLAQLSARQDNREAKPELCVDIERETGGKVRRWSLRPNDWHRIWPELIGQPGAPVIPTTAANDTPDQAAA